MNFIKHAQPQLQLFNSLPWQKQEVLSNACHKLYYLCGTNLRDEDKLRFDFQESCTIIVFEYLLLMSDRLSTKTANYIYMVAAVFVNNAKLTLHHFYNRYLAHCDVAAIYRL